MPYSVLRSRGLIIPRLDPRRVPDCPVQIDPTSELGAGPVGYWLLNSTNPVDLTGINGQATPGSAGVPNVSAYSYGPGNLWPSNANTSVGWQVNSGPILGFRNAWTVVAVVQSASGSGDIMYAERQSSGSLNDLLYLGRVASSLYGMLWYRNDAGTLVQINGTQYKVGDGNTHVVAGIFTGSQFQLVIDGRLDTAAAWTGANTNFTNGCASAIGYDPHNTEMHFANWIGSVACYSRALSLGDLLTYTAEPFGMLRPVARRTWFVPPATSYSIFLSDSAASSDAPTIGARVIVTLSDTTTSSDSTFLSATANLSFSDITTVFDTASVISAQLPTVRLLPPTISYVQMAPGLRLNRIIK